MKRLIVILLCFVPLVLFARQRNDLSYVHSFAVQVGVDVGGGVPVPFSYVPPVFRPLPKVLPSIGVKYAFVLHPNWKLGGELTYKHIEMNAEALVENMKVTLPWRDENGDYLIQYFTGQAKIMMINDILELPVYVSYSFPSQRHKILLGGYAVWVISGKFVNKPLLGFIGNEPDDVDVVITSGDQIPPEQTDFSRYLAKWDAGLLFGYECQVYKRINMGVRITCGFKDIFDFKVLEFKMLQMRGTVVISYDLWRF